MYVARAFTVVYEGRGIKPPVRFSPVAGIPLPPASSTNNTKILHGVTTASDWMALPCICSLSPAEVSRSFSMGRSNRHNTTATIWTDSVWYRDLCKVAELSRSLLSFPHQSGHTIGLRRIAHSDGQRSRCNERGSELSALSYCLISCFFNGGGGGGGAKHFRFLKLAGWRENSSVVFCRRAHCLVGLTGTGLEL